MSHPLEQRIVALRRRVRWTTAIYGSSIVVAAVLGALTALGMLDYLLRFQDRGLRIIASLLLLGVAAGMLYRYAVAILSVPLRDADLAIRVGRRFPGLNDGLVSAVEFLGQHDSDATAGSPALRRAVVERITAETQRLDFAEVIYPRPTACAVLVLAATALVACGLVVLSPTSAGTAVTRLVNPFGDASWPRANHLAIRQAPQRVARGQSFQVEVVDAEGARLPPEVRIHYRLDRVDGDAVEETQRMSMAHGVAVARRDNILRPFSYRIEGGDDQSLPWFDVAVAEPPMVASASIEIIPPSYTGWPATRANRHIRALIGSEVKITAKATTPLRSAAVSIDAALNIPAQLDDDGQSFTANFQVERSGAYWFDLVDRDGLAGGGDDDRWEIRAISDSSPTVSIDRPASNLVVTPQATVPLQVTAKDDLAIREIAVLFHRNEFAAGETLPLWTRREPAQPRAADAAVDSRTFEYRWELGPLELKPSSHLIFRAAAADDLLQRGQSEPRSLAIVTPEELQNHISARKNSIRNQLERALTVERSCRQQVKTIRADLAQRKQLRTPDVDLLRAVHHNQMDVEQLLTSRRDGVPKHVLDLLADLENNHLQGDGARQRLSALLNDIERIERQYLPLAGRELLSAVKSGQAALEGQGRATELNESVVAALAAADRQQEMVIASVEEMLGRLAQSDSYRRLMREMARLLRQQEEVARRTADAGRRTLAHDLRDVAPQDLADLKAAAGQQLELARMLDRVLQEMEQVGADPAQKDGPTAAMVADGLSLAHRLSVGVEMRSVGRQIADNHIGQATRGQKQIELNLQAVIDVLAARRGSAGEQTDPNAAPDAGAGPSKSADAQAPGADRPAARDWPEKEDGKQAAGDAAGVPGGDQARQPDAEQRRALMSRLWGQLPPHARQQLVQPPVEEFPPKYEAEIEEYFRRLAEEK